MKPNVLFLATLAMLSVAKTAPQRTCVAPYNYSSIVNQTADMVQDATAQRLAANHGLQILNLTWEDTGRFKNSAVGPNISDMTIQVEHGTSREVTCMPVIRFPNFEDKTGDVPADKFYLMVGNEKGKPLTRISLKQFLQNPRRFMNKPSSWAGTKQSLWANRDSHVLVSAQACFLPIPKTGTATFNPVLFNYQSYEGNPAVLTILATRQGTSITVIDNQRDGFSSGSTWGQRLFYNKNGQRTSFTGTRMSDFSGSLQGKQVAVSGTAAQKAGLNMVMLIQVPLKQKKQMRKNEMLYDCVPAPCMESAAKCKGISSVENAVIGHGKVEGPFTEIDNLAIERDPAFPIRVTVQFYKATDNGVVNDRDLSEVANQISKVYSEANYVGSLVTGGETNRPTEYLGDKSEPSNWWDQFWKNQENQTKQFFGW